MERGGGKGRGGSGKGGWGATGEGRREEAGSGTARRDEAKWGEKDGRERESVYVWLKCGSIVLKVPLTASLFQFYCF